MDALFLGSARWQGVHLPSRCCGPRLTSSSAVTWTSSFGSSCPSSTEQCSCLDPDRSPVYNGMGPLSSSLLGPPLAVPAKPLPGGGRAGGNWMRTLVDPFDRGWRADRLWLLELRKCPQPHPKVSPGATDMAGLGGRGNGDSPLAGVPLAVASGKPRSLGGGVLA